MLTPETRRKLARIRAKRTALRAEERQAIIEASTAGGSLREIAEVIGYSHQQVSRILADRDES